MDTEFMAPLTESQRVAFERMLRLGRLYYSGVPLRCCIRARLWPLMVGPTGSGKSYLARRLANSIGAQYLRLSYGDWVVQGAKLPPTLYHIIWAALGASRVVVHLDELDKMPIDSAQDWARSVANEIWGLLDGALPIARMLQDPDIRVALSAENMQELSSGTIARKIFIVGSGTWQSAFDEAVTQRSSIGFACDSAGPKSIGTAAREVVSKLESMRGPASELLARFDGEVLFISPPSLGEALRMVSFVGALEYGQRMDVDVEGRLKRLLPRQGFRAIESVVTWLMLMGWRPKVAPEELSAPKEPNRPETAGVKSSA